MTACGTALHCYADNKRMSDKHLTTDFSPAEACWLWINGNERSKEYVGEQKHGWSVL